MDYNTLLDLVADLGYQLAMCGAETYRVEESVKRIMASYGIEAEVFAITNCLIVGLTTPEGNTITRMRRIGFHGNDLNGVECFNSLSRKICTQVPEPKIATEWLKVAKHHRATYNFPISLLGHFLAAFGFAILFGGKAIDGLCAGLCGLLIGLVDKALVKMKVNTFFSTMTCAFLMAFLAYMLGTVRVAYNTDTVIIGALMLLVPGLLITNAMRDIIFGDTISGVNRIVQVLLIAAAIAIGTGAAWNFSDKLFGISLNPAPVTYPIMIQILAATLGSLGFALIFNIHGSGFLLCVFGGGICWAVYSVMLQLGSTDIIAYFIASTVGAVYAEAMARIRKYPAISYLVISIIPLIPGAGVYYTTNHLVRGDMQAFSAQGIHTLAIAGVIAIGILMISTLVHLWTVWRSHRK